MELSADGSQLVAITVNLLHDVLHPQNLLILLLQFSKLEHLLFCFGELASGGTGGVIAFLPVHLHIPVNVYFEDVLIFPAEVVAKGAGVADHDV